MGTSFEERVRECVPSEATYVNVEAPKESRSMLELGDGSLLGVRGATRQISNDGGMTWSSPRPSCRPTAPGWTARSGTLLG